MSAVLRVAAGCELATPGGTRTAMMLEPGDVVAIGAGLALRVRHATRTLSVRDAGRRALWPIAVAAGSLGADTPATDLVVAPDQVLPLADGLGAPARCLVDGMAIRRIAPEGLIDLVEIHLDAPVAALATEADLPALVEAVAAARLPPAGPPEGAFDHADNRLAAGWARDPARPGQPLLLAIEIDGVARALLLADLHREDLALALGDSGYHGFRIDFAPALSRRSYHHLTIRRAWDRAPVPGGEMLVTRAPSLGEALAALNTLAPETQARALSAALAAAAEAARA
jgi:hypothetical protein